MARRVQPASGSGSDFGSQGGKAPSREADKIEGGTPRTGFADSPSGEAFTFGTPEGTGGTGVGSAGAH